MRLARLEDSKSTQTLTNGLSWVRLSRARHDLQRGPPVMSRPDITGDAQQIKDVIIRGGVAILQGDVGDGLLTATPQAARKTIDVKGRAAHKRHGMLGCADFRHEAQIPAPAKPDKTHA